jgi:hypothetical protein
MNQAGPISMSIGAGFPRGVSHSAAGLFFGRVAVHAASVSFFCPTRKVRSLPNSSE